MSEKRCPQQKTWEDFPTKKDEQGWHCRFCGKVRTGRKRAWCERACEKAVLLLVHWPYIRVCILRRDKWKCQFPKEDGTLCLRPAHEVDHIVELADGGSYHEWSNLRAGCEECHTKKSNRMRTARAAAKRVAAKKARDEEKAQFLAKTVFSS